MKNKILTNIRIEKKVKLFLIFSLSLCIFSNLFAKNNTPNLLLSNDEYDKIHNPGNYNLRKQKEESARHERELARQAQEKKVIEARKAYQNSPEYWATVARIGKSQSASFDSLHEMFYRDRQLQLQRDMLELRARENQEDRINQILIESQRHNRQPTSFNCDSTIDGSEVSTKCYED